MSRPLNPSLYNRLERLFGDVQISSEGEEMICSYRRIATDSSGSPKLVIDHPGEYYKVNCPFCGDKRHRLYVNHRWSVPDKYNKLNLWLAICYNENCLHDYNTRLHFKDLVFGAGCRIPESESQVMPGKRVPIGQVREMNPPGRVIGIDKLPDTHPAKDYLETRGFDADTLSKQYGLWYCDFAPMYPYASNRIIIPVYRKAKLVGWQARYIGEITWKANDGPPKYWSAPGMPRSKLLYNFDVARKQSYLVVCEGPSDVWSFGPEAVALFGKSASRMQREQIVQYFQDRPVILLLDPNWDEDKEKKHHIDKLYEQLTDSPLRDWLVKVFLPLGSDPGSLDRKFMLELIRDEAAKRGIKLPRRRRETSK
jgi:hypothetical protein